MCESLIDMSHIDAISVTMVKLLHFTLLMQHTETISDRDRVSSGTMVKLLYFTLLMQHHADATSSINR